MALNDSCHLLIETKHHFIQKFGGGGLEQNLEGGLEPLSPIALLAPPLHVTDSQTDGRTEILRRDIVRTMDSTIIAR